MAFTALPGLDGHRLDHGNGDGPYFFSAFLFWVVDADGHGVSLDGSGRFGAPQQSQKTTDPLVGAPRNIGQNILRTFILKKGSMKSSSSLWREFYLYLNENKKFWMIPLLIVIMGMAILTFFSGTPLAPFIYTLF